jgi:hypothetical protein
LFLRHQTMEKVQKHNSFNTNTPSSESYKNYWHSRLRYSSITQKQNKVFRSTVLRPNEEWMSKSKLKTLLIFISDIKETTLYISAPPEQSTKHSILKFWNIYSSMYVKRDWIFGQASRFCIITMHIPKVLLVYKKTIVGTSTILLLFGHVWHFHVPETKVSFWTTWRHPLQCFQA